MRCLSIPSRAACPPGFLRRLDVPRARGAALALGLAALVVVAWAPAPASAATATALEYSTDGGATWSDAAVVAPGGEVLVRHWFTNTGDDVVDGAALASTVPDRFVVAAGSTAVCLNPSTVDPAAPDLAELACEVADEGAVWSGADLAISPTAAHFGFSAGATTGPLAAGRVRYLNLQQCYYSQDRVDRNDSYTSLLRSSEGEPDAGTNVSDVADVVPDCDPVPFTQEPARSGVTPLDLFDSRYLNLQQCRWVDGGSGGFQRAVTSYIPDTGSAAWAAGSSTSNFAGAVPACSATPAPGWSLTPDQSGVQALDLLEHRYVNLQACLWTSSLGPSLLSHLTTVSDPTAAVSWTSASDEPQVDDRDPWPCPSRPLAHDPGGSVYLDSFDLLDSSRSAGYVAYSLRAPDAPTPEQCAHPTDPGHETSEQTATLGAASVASQSDTASLTIDWTGLPDGGCPIDPIPLVDPVALVGVGAAATLLGKILRRR